MDALVYPHLHRLDVAEVVQIRQDPRSRNWTPSLTAPLTLPGINTVEGEYLLAVNGRELHATDNLDSFFDGTAGKQTVPR